ncbi:unnamed protein product [Pseudo-nitzschia multistriata]|uniref:Uncharacterized protein n=1 Tax=Pseudo-nitzschia multistriata TaxID=183589 RepID=A0A448Z121_9STRA|nr:unnamed protein product [Pseudo-nitzschia multistriata]
MRERTGARFCWLPLALAAFALAVALVPPALSLAFGGYCTRCGTHHTLPTTEAAKRAALDLRDRMVRSGRIDIDELPGDLRAKLLAPPLGESGSNGSSSNTAGDLTGIPSASDLGLDPSLATERLYERRGKMFGVLVCEKPSTDGDNTGDGSETVVLKAYAGKMGGRWNLRGWAPLVGRVPEEIPEFRRLSAAVTEKFAEIEEASLSPGDGSTATLAKLKAERAALSARAMEEIRRHQLLTNLRGDTTLPITAAFLRGSTRLPGGTGDCAAPKLVAEAIRRGLRPVGICEVFVGATGGMSTTKADGEFYDACESRCEQIAGFLLCGLDDR